MRELEMKSRPFPAPVPHDIPVPFPPPPDSRLRANVIPLPRGVANLGRKLSKSSVLNSLQLHLQTNNKRHVAQSSGPKM